MSREEQGSDYQLLWTWIYGKGEIEELERFWGRTEQEQEELEERRKEDAHACTWPGQLGRHDWGIPTARFFARRVSPYKWKLETCSHRHEQRSLVATTSIYLPSGEGLTVFRVRSVCLGREGKAGREKRDGGERPPRCGVLGRLPGGSGGSGDPGW